MLAKCSRVLGEVFVLGEMDVPRLEAEAVPYETIAASINYAFLELGYVSATDDQEESIKRFLEDRDVFISLPTTYIHLFTFRIGRIRMHIFAAFIISKLVWFSNFNRGNGQPKILSTSGNELLQVINRLLSTFETLETYFANVFKNAKVSELFPKVRL